MRTIVDDAREFAITAHGEQKYGDQPYWTHLLETQNVLCEFGHNDLSLLAAAWLHDVCEDTPVSIAEIEERFGAVVAEIVRHLTRDKSHSRRDCYNRMAGIRDATIVKLADRIANVRASVRGNPKMLEKYREDHVTFFAALYRDWHGAYPMWVELKQLLNNAPAATGRQ